MLKFFIIAISMLPFVAAGQGKYGKPVDFPIVLAGNVGELRANHFHSGIDIKTGGVVGKPVFAVADGYVSRLNISPTGYGNALYITHNDGSQAVYGHLDRFEPSIAEYVKREQYKRKSFSVDLFPDAGEFPVSTGEKVAFSGNSGSSGGPHLHFEIRDAAARPLNIGQLGLYDIADTKAPTIYRVLLVEIDSVAGVGVHHVAATYQATLGADGNYTLNEAVKLRKASYFAYEVLDFKDGATNTMGVYSIAQSVSGVPSIKYAIDKIDFKTTRYINTLVLYKEHKRSRRDVIRAYISDNNYLEMYSDAKNGGIILPPDSPTKVLTEIDDDNGNRSTLRFDIEPDKHFNSSEKTIFATTTDIYGNSKILADSLMGKYLTPAYFNKNFNYRDPIVSLSIPSGALYNSALLDISVDTTIRTSTPIYSPIVDISTSDCDLLQNSFTISIRDTKLPDELKSYALIAYVDERGRLTSVGGAHEGEEVTAKHRGFGRYCIAADNTPPQIKPSSASGSDLSARKEVAFTISDNLSGIDKYVGQIDGVWALFEYDPKNKKLYHRFDSERFKKGTVHQLTLSIIDAKGNKSTYKGEYKW